MAAATVLSLASAGYGIYNSIQQKNKAEAALNDLDVPELDNAFKDIQISTLGSDLIREEGQRVSSNLIDVAQQGGQGSVMSMIPQIQSYNTKLNRAAQVDLDKQQQKREYAIAYREGRLGDMKEIRYENDVAGLGNAISVADQNMWNGIRGGISSIAALENELRNKDNDDDDDDDYTNSFKTISSAFSQIQAMPSNVIKTN